jgi:endonuclease/exonuclease/phosphatase family metal-dependent hydrolase
MRLKLISLAILVPFITATAPAAEEPAPPDTLRVLSYNIRHGRGMDGKVDLDRSARVIADAKPNLVALQEVDRGVARSGKIDIAEALGGKLGLHHEFGLFMPHQGGEYGLAVLSEFPIVETRVHQLPDGAEPRVALEVEVDVPLASAAKKRISFICVHFDGTKPDDFRFAQATKLLEILRPRKHPVIIAGDYNDVRGSRTLDAFAEEFPIPVWAAPTFPSDPPDSEIDFILWRGLPQKAERKIIEEKMASDHRPVLAVVSMEE